MIVVFDYGMGNVGSILNMLKKVGAHATITADPAVIERADKLILPGVGAFDNGMRSLHDRGLVQVLNAKVLEGKTPLLGICLGMQLLCRRSEEGQLPGLGWIDADTIRFRMNDSASKLKVPHMGWDHVIPRKESAVFPTGGDVSQRFYFVHSYHVVCRTPEDVLATCEYGDEFTAAIQKDNILGVQFHPEKSHKYGMALLKRFVEDFNPR